MKLIHKLLKVVPKRMHRETVRGMQAVIDAQAAELDALRTKNTEQRTVDTTPKKPKPSGTHQAAKLTYRPTPIFRRIVTLITDPSINITPDGKLYTPGGRFIGQIDTHGDYYVTSEYICDVINHKHGTNRRKLPKGFMPTALRSKIIQPSGHTKYPYMHALNSEYGRVSAARLNIEFVSANISAK